jgi:hypothetical protein
VPVLHGQALSRDPGLVDGSHGERNPSAARRRAVPGQGAYAGGRRDSLVPAGRIGLLAETLDAEGRILAQEVAWLLPRVLMPGTRAYFEIPAPRAGPAYRVSVFSFDRVDVDRRRPWLW